MRSSLEIARQAKLRPIGELAAALLAGAAAVGAVRLVEINLASAPGDARLQRGRDLARRALAARERALAASP